MVMKLLAAVARACEVTTALRSVVDVAIVPPGTSVAASLPTPYKTLVAAVAAVAAAV